VSLLGGKVCDISGSKDELPRPRYISVGTLNTDLEQSDLFWETVLALDCGLLKATAVEESRSKELLWGS
jgi:hypothetical protein